MNEFEDISVQQVDRLVDGELSEPERREVLLAADSEPESWRRIALAFLEAQTVRHELSELIKPAVIQRSGGVLEVASEAPSGRRTAALVACCLLAFGFGRWSNLSDALMATKGVVPSPSPRTFAGGDDRGRMVAGVMPEDTQQHQTLRLDFDDLLGGPPQSVDVPVVEDSPDDPQELLTGPPVIPPEIQRALLRAGRRVHEQRQLFEVELSDGRRGIVPVSNVLVENSGLDVFQ